MKIFRDDLLPKNLIIYQNWKHKIKEMVLKQKCIFRDLSNYSLMGILQNFKVHLWHLKSLEML